MVVQMFGLSNSASGTTISSYNKNSRYYNGGNFAPTLLGDANGSSSVSFTATANGNAYGYGGIAVDLSP